MPLKILLTESQGLGISAFSYPSCLHRLAPPCEAKHDSWSLNSSYAYCISDYFDQSMLCSRTPGGGAEIPLEGERACKLYLLHLDVLI